MAPTRNQRVALVAALVLTSFEKKKRKRRLWTKEYLLLRNKLSNIQILGALEPKDLRNYLRMGDAQFENLLQLVTPFIQKQNTNFRNSVSARERLTVTLRYLAMGNTYQDLKFTALISQPLLSKIIPETCRAIYKCLHKYIKVNVEIKSYMVFICLF